VVTTVAEAYLSVLKDRGVSRLFVNAGTDFAPFVEAYARQKQSGLDFPELVVCAHENLAISMFRSFGCGVRAAAVGLFHDPVLFTVLFAVHNPGS
jgi:hypothetical protein